MVAPRSRFFGERFPCMRLALVLLLLMSAWPVPEIIMPFITGAIACEMFC
jgi:hypothetical protein